MVKINNETKTILVIEKDSQVRKHIEEILASEKLSTIATGNGKKGLRLAQEQIPDLIICDRNAADLDGYSVLRKLAEKINTAAIPVILLAEDGDRSAWRRAMEMGADDYLIKPIVTEELRNAIAVRLKKQKIYQESTNQELEELRSNITNYLPHELRTPLTGILASSDFLLAELESLDREVIQEMLQCIRFSGERLGRLIKNCSLYWELEQLKNNPDQLKALRDSHTTSAMSVIQDVANKQVRGAKRETDLQLKLEDAGVEIGTSCLAKLLEELIDNACKFSQPGTPICVTSNLKNNRFIVSVSDWGRGMTAQQIATIAPYVQFERQIHEQQGAGLGLAIAQRITELHQGQLLIQSKPTKQTTVQVCLPKFGSKL